MFHELLPGDCAVQGQYILFLRYIKLKFVIKTFFLQKDGVFIELMAQLMTSNILPMYAIKEQKIMTKTVLDKEKIRSTDT